MNVLLKQLYYYTPKLNQSFDVRIYHGFIGAGLVSLVSFQILTTFNHISTMCSNKSNSLNRGWY